MDTIIDYHRKTESRKRLAEEEIAQQRRDYDEVFGTEAGKRVFRDLIARAGVFASEFKASADIYYQYGRRSIGLEILQIRGLASIEGVNKIIEESYDEYRRRS